MRNQPWEGKGVKESVQDIVHSGWPANSWSSCEEARNERKRKSKSVENWKNVAIGDCWGKLRSCIIVKEMLLWWSYYSVEVCIFCSISSARAKVAFSLEGIPVSRSALGLRDYTIQLKERTAQPQTSSNNYLLMMMKEDYSSCWTLMDTQARVSSRNRCITFSLWNWYQFASSNAQKIFRIMAYTCCKTT